MHADEIRRAAIEALEEIKATDVVEIDVRKMTSLFDYMIVASAESTRQTRALANNVQEKLKHTGGKVYGVEGEQSGEWVLIDLGDVVVHIMQPAVRSYYNLEELWGGGAPARQSARRAGASAARPAS